jgi:hypothetical protein
MNFLGRVLPDATQSGIENAYLARLLYEDLAEIALRLATEVKSRSEAYLKTAEALTAISKQVGQGVHSPSSLFLFCPPELYQWYIEALELIYRHDYQALLDYVDYLPNVIFPIWLAQDEFPSDFWSLQLDVSQNGFVRIPHVSRSLAAKVKSRRLLVVRDSHQVTLKSAHFATTLDIASILARIDGHKFVGQELSTEHQFC